MASPRSRISDTATAAIQPIHTYAKSALFRPKKRKSAAIRTANSENNPSVRNPRNAKKQKTDNQQNQLAVKNANEDKVIATNHLPVTSQLNKYDKHLVIEILADAILRLCIQGTIRKKQEESLNTYKLTLFDRTSIAKISIKDFITRILKYAELDLYHLPIMLRYFTNIATQCPNVYFHEYNIHSFLLLGLMISNKLNDDGYYSNRRYAEIGDLDVKEINKLEVEFLYLINFALYIDINTFRQSEAEIITNIDHVLKSRAQQQQSNTPRI